MTFEAKPVASFLLFLDKLLVRAVSHQDLCNLPDRP